MSGGPSLGSSFVSDAGRNGVTLSEHQQAQLARYRDLLLTWNDRFNLTAIREPDQVEQRLLLDALEMLPEIERQVGFRHNAVVDVGTGAGFPGLVFAIAKPAWSLTLIEATGKKVRFLEHVVHDLGLDQVTPVHARAEEIGHDQDYRARFDVAVARAVASLPALLELCGPLLRRGGRAFFPKSIDMVDELHRGRTVAPMVGMTIEGDEMLPGSRTRLVTALKVAETPMRYPRRAGVPARQPLHGVVPAETAARGGS